MDQQLLTILKLCLLALVYLFFLRVLRAVWVEIRGPKVVATNAKAAKREAKRIERRSAPVELSVVEPESQRGRRFPLTDELTVGRAAGCHVTIDDTYASQIHARVFARDGQLFVEDLGSTNGTYLNRKKVQGPQPMHRGDRLQVGNTVMELV
ncbi:MAG: FHA domain-containing protein, partial [Acidimicrobiales bacterium]|nr:FHA domain-containing protein [Acidimicrobiales bacterium]